MHADQELWRGEGTILLIDDEQMIRLISGKMIEYMGFSVLTAAGGAEGLELFRAHRDDIVLVIVDLGMPEMTGEEVCTALREIDPDVRLVISTGNDTDADSRALQPLGANGFIRKPYEMKELNAGLRRLLEAC